MLLAYHILFCSILNVTVIYLCIHFLLAPVKKFVLQTEIVGKYILLFFRS